MCHALPYYVLLCSALLCSALLCSALLSPVGPHVWVPKLASEASIVCFVVSLGYVCASLLQARSDSHVNMDFSQQAGSESQVHIEVCAH